MEDAPSECIICVGGGERNDLVAINGWKVKRFVQCGFEVLDIGCGLAISWQLAVTMVIRFMVWSFQVSRSTMPLRN